MLGVSGPRNWTRGLLLAALVALGVAAPARAGVIVPLDPTGGGGSNSNNLLQVSSFAYLPGNALAVNSIPAIAAGPAGGVPIPVLYQAILGSINTVGANSASLGSNNGNIIISSPGGTNNTGVQFVITGQFTETVASESNFVNGVPTSVTFNPDFGAGTNEIKIYAQPSSDANINDPNVPNQFPGAGATLILTGHAIPANWTSSFNVNASSLPGASPGPEALNQHAGGSGDYAGVTTVTGSGNTSVTVAVDSFNASYFPTGAMPLLTLNFNTISTGVPFRAVDPALQMFTGYAPNIGAINGINGPDFLFQSQANNDFTAAAVPEPSTISMALTAIGLITLAGVRNLRRRNTSLTA